MREEKKTNRTKDIFRLFSGALIPFAFFFLQFIECLHENAGFFLCAGEYSWIFVYSFKQKKKLLWLSVYNYRILERICLQMYKPINSSHFDRQCKGDVAYLNRFFFCIFSSLSILKFYRFFPALALKFLDSMSEGKKSGSLDLNGNFPLLPKAINYTMIIMVDVFFLFCLSSNSFRSIAIIIPDRESSVGDQAHFGCIFYSPW